MTNTTYIKQFINNFNFPDPDWSRLPPNFPNLPKDGLNKEETHLLGAIKLAYSVNEGGRNLLFRKTVKVAVIAVVISLISFISLISLREPGKIARAVNAATISANLKQNFEGVVESTRSAIFKGN